MSATLRTGGWGRGWAVQGWCLSAAKPGVEAERRWAPRLRWQTAFLPDSGGQASGGGFLEKETGDSADAGDLSKGPLLRLKFILAILFSVLLAFRLCPEVKYKLSPEKCPRVLSFQNIL